MKKDRSDWMVRKVTFAEAEEIDDQYYASLSMVERLELLMDLRSRIDTDCYRIEPVARKRHIHETEEI